MDLFWSWQPFLWDSLDAAAKLLGSASSLAQGYESVSVAPSARKRVFVTSDARNISSLVAEWYPPLHGKGLVL